jgi:rhodanese-related sulfurtransferase
MAENLRSLGLDVAIVEMGNQVMAPLDYPMAVLVQQHLRSMGVELHLGTTVTEIDRDEYGLRVKTKNGKSMSSDVVILSIGVRPDTRLASSAGLAIGKSGGIVVNEYLQTSDPNIYAVGDAIEFTCPITGIPSTTFLAGPANKQGRICANNLVFGNRQHYHGSINTAIAKVFEMTIATAGIASKRLAANNIQHVVSTTFSGSHAEYYPGSKKMTIQISFSPVSGQLYGAQVVGYDGVDKRIDLLASVIRKGGTVYDLIEIEHAYAPPFSSAKDPVNIAGFVAENMLNKRIVPFYWDEVSSLPAEAFVLDVRSTHEYDQGHLAGARNLPVDEIRGRIHELPTDQPVYVYCQIGLRGYLATRILLQSGFRNVFNLSGGFRLWDACTKETELLFDTENVIDTIK